MYRLLGVQAVGYTGHAVQAVGCTGCWVQAVGSVFSVRYSSHLMKKGALCILSKGKNIARIRLYVGIPKWPL